MSILVIDDSGFMRSLMRMSLQSAGYTVEEVDPTSLFDVLQALHRVRPDLLITDYEMPKCNGETLVRAVREDRVLKGTPIMVVSSHRDEVLIERLSHWNLVGYLTKPLTPETIVARVKEALDRT